MEGRTDNRRGVFRDSAFNASGGAFQITIAHGKGRFRPVGHRGTHRLSARRPGDSARRRITTSCEQCTHATQPSHKTLVILINTLTTSRPDIGDEARRKERQPQPMCGAQGSVPQLSPLLSRNRVEIFVAKRRRIREVGDNRKRGRAPRYLSKYVGLPLTSCFRLSFALAAFAGSQSAALSRLS